MIKLKSAFVNTANINFITKYMPYDNPDGLNSMYELHINFSGQGTLILRYVTESDMNKDFFKLKP